MTAGENRPGRSVATFALKREELVTPDNLLLAALAFVALLFGYLSFSPPSLTARGEGGEKVALIADIDSTVKRKPAGAIAWDEADAPDELYTGDQIFTDKNSQARVKFDDGSEISIAENSLVKIEKQGGKTTLDMSKGFVSGKFAGAGAGDFTIKMGGTQVKLDKGAELQVKVDPNDKNATRIALVNGDAKIQSATGENLALGKNQVLSVDTKTGQASVQEVSLTLVLPKSGETIEAGDNPSVFFKWDAKGEGLTYTVVLASDSAFKNVLQRRDTSNKALAVQAPPSGVYYWKVLSSSPSGKKDESLEASFTVQRMDAPELLAPVAGKTFQMESAQKPVTVGFLWRAQGPAKGFDVEVAKDKGFGDKVIARKLDSNSFDTKDLGQGVYYWRVRARGEDQTKAGPYSAAQEFRVDRLGLPAAPELKDPESGKRFPPNEAITFRWSPLAGVDSYQFDLSRNKTFAAGDGTVSKTVTGNALTLIPENPGTHFWRVRAVDPFGRDAPWSEIRPLGLDAATPQLISPENDAAITLAQKDMKVDFAWLKSQGASGYRIEIARDAAFADKVAGQKVEGTGYAWNKLKPGRYYWRVRPEIPGVKEAAASPARSFELKGLDLLPGPGLKDRYYFRLPPPPPKNPGTAMYRFFKYFLAAGTAKAQDASSEVDPTDSDKVIIHWKPIAGAESYYVEVAGDPDFAKTELKHRTKAPTFVWPEATPGRYYLRAASVDGFEQTGKFSRISELIVNYRAPKLFEPADQATLKNDGGKASLDFTWQNVGGDPKLTLEIAKTADFTQPEVSKAVKGGSTKVSGLGEGVWYWRVRARYRSNLPVESGKPFRFQIAGVKLKAPEIASPKAGTVFKTDQKTLAVTVDWNEVKGAESYQLAVARDEEFKDLAADKAVDEGTATVDLAPGTYYAKVHALGAGKARGPDSATRRIDVKGELAAPVWEKPDAGQEFVMTGKDLPQVDLVYKGVEGAASYLVEVSTSDQFKKLVKTATPSDLKATVALPKGTYYARVRAVDATAAAGKPSEVLPFAVVRQELDAPDLIYPEDGDQLSRSKSVRLNWTKENAFTGYRVVMSRDPQFKNVVFDKTVEGDAQAVPVPKSGKYYWYVEGKDKQKKYAMRSDVQTFKISDYAGAGSDRIRVMGAYAPSAISNTMVSNQINNSLTVAAFNSFVFSGQYWFSRPFGLDAAYQRKSAELYSNDESLQGSTDQKPLEFIPQSFDLRTRFRLMLGKTPLSPELHARAGYMYKTFYTYYATSRTAIDLQETKTHSLSLGIGTKFPLTLDKYLEGALDLAKPLAANPSQVTGGQHLMVDTGFYMLFPSRLTAGLGYRYANATYSFVDDDHDVAGILQEKSYSLLGSLGYGF